MLALFLTLLLAAGFGLLAPEAALATHPGLSNERDQDRSGQTQVKQFRGELVNMAGPEWRIRDENGHEIRMRVDEQLMQTEERPRIGEQVEVYLDPEGRATSLRRLERPKSSQ